MTLTLSGYTAGGEEFPLHAPLSLEWNSDRFIPCDSLSVTLPSQWEGEEFSALSARLEGQALFDGIVDRQSWEFSPSGKLLRLECRSRTALLLDNEVKPYIYFQLTSRQLFDRFAAPFGVKGYRFPYEAKQNFMQVRKGASCWTVIEDFCRFAYRKYPFLGRDGFLTLDALNTVRHVLSNREGGALRWSGLTVQRRNDKLVSRLYMKTATETYGYYYGFVVDNPEAVRRGVRRERYYHPEDKISVYAQAEARKRITDGNRESFLAEAVLPGLHRIFPGDRALLPDGLAGKELFVRSVRLRMDGTNGAVTRLGLQEADENVAG